MELSPEEYGAYWRASLRVAGGVLLGAVGYLVTAPLLAHPEAGATGLGVVLLVATVLAACYLVILGLGRTVRIAVDAEMRG
ncbi:hypothetical protein OB905_11060 [Halobacteria archaeon AArc-dxtr1]|nr:hypothetical protein [Halobacteria archaeon AArc-dxtr1]